MQVHEAHVQGRKMPSQSASEAHRFYIIRSAYFGDHWRAQAWRGDRAVGEVERGMTREEAVSAVKASRDADDRREREARASGAPSVEAYERAFAALQPLSHHHQRMLDAHLAAPDHTLTASELAAAAGWPNFSSVNAHYGDLGRRLAEQLDWIPPRRADGTPVWTAALATAPDGTLEHQDTQHWRWRLRPEVVAALSG